MAVDIVPSPLMSVLSSVTTPILPATEVTGAEVRKPDGFPTRG